jgi:molybdenum cofactor guanylyltransferase
MTGIILSGGKNKRMGANKAFLRLGTERLIDRTVRVFRARFSEVILVTNEPLLYLDQHITIVTDLMKNKGPLMGIYTGLFYASCEHIFIAACDMPFLNDRFIQYMIDHTTDEDIVVPASPGGLEPLHAIYSKRCLGSIRRLLDADLLKITGFYKGLRQKVIGEDVIKAYDPEGRMFMNVNTPADLQNNSFFLDK